MRELEPVWPGAPRLVPGVPFPPVRFVPELHPHPRRDPAGSLRDAPAAPPGLPPERWREDASYLLGIDLYHAGYLWEAHEQWEAGYHAAVRSKNASADSWAHPALLQALIQLAAALLQAHRGRGAGVRFLAGAVVLRLTAVAEGTPAGARLAGLDPRALLDATRRHFAPALTGVGDAATTIGPPPRLEVGP